MLNLEFMVWIFFFLLSMDVAVICLSCVGKCDVFYLVSSLYEVSLLLMRWISSSIMILFLTFKGSYQIVGWGGGESRIRD